MIRVKFCCIVVMGMILSCVFVVMGCCGWELVVYGELTVDEEHAVCRKTSISFTVWLWFGSDSPPRSGFGFDLCCKRWLGLIYVIYFLFVCIVVDYGWFVDEMVGEIMGDCGCFVVDCGFGCGYSCGLLCGFGCGLLCGVYGFILLAIVFFSLLYIIYWSVFLFFVFFLTDCLFRYKVQIFNYAKAWYKFIVISCILIILYSVCLNFSASSCCWEHLSLIG